MPEQFAITMLGGFDVYRDNQLLDLPPSCRRLVALAALKRRALPRGWMCQVLWPTTRPDRATARLRTTLWRLRPMGADGLLVEVHPEPDAALCDAPQLLPAAGFADFAEEIRALVALMGRVVG